jgi:hypothetical protein
MNLSAEKEQLILEFKTAIPISELHVAQLDSIYEELERNVYKCSFIIRAV